MARTTSAGRTAVVLAGSVALLAACGGDDEDGAAEKAVSTPAPAAGQAVNVDVADFKFKPGAVTVKAGGTLTFVNRDKAPHTAQTELNPKTAEFDTGRLEKGDQKVVKLKDPGRFAYFCAYHRFMEGTVEVVE